MRPLAILTLLLAALVAAGSARAGDLEDAKAAYDRGEHTAALGLWRPLAEADDATAQFWMGALYDLGRGVAQDFTVATQWYRKAADQGHAGAQHNLGHMYELGHGVPAEFAMAAAAVWYRRAAEQGFTASQINLGVLYTNGRGIKRDYVEAWKWFSLAGSTANRRLVADRMTPFDIAEAERLARAWTAKPER